MQRLKKYGALLEGTAPAEGTIAACSSRAVAAGSALVSEWLRPSSYILNWICNQVEELRPYSTPIWVSWGQDTMRQQAKAFAEAMMVAASRLANISQAALKPIDMFVNWLEAVYAE